MSRVSLRPIIGASSHVNAHVHAVCRPFHTPSLPGHPFTHCFLLSPPLSCHHGLPLQFSSSRPYLQPWLAPHRAPSAVGHHLGPQAPLSLCTPLQPTAVLDPRCHPCFVHVRHLYFFICFRICHQISVTNIDY